MYLWNTIQISIIFLISYLKELSYEQITIRIGLTQLVITILLGVGAGILAYYIARKQIKLGNNQTRLTLNQMELATWQFNIHNKDISIDVCNTDLDRIITRIHILDILIREAKNSEGKELLRLKLEEERRLCNELQDHIENLVKELNEISSHPPKNFKMIVKDKIEVSSNKVSR